MAMWTEWGEVVTTEVSLFGLVFNIGYAHYILVISVALFLFSIGLLDRQSCILSYNGWCNITEDGKLQSGRWHRSTSGVVTAGRGFVNGPGIWLAAVYRGHANINSTGWSGKNSQGRWVVYLRCPGR